MSESLYCPICGVQSTLKCGGCRNVVYCGKEHQKDHWRKEHKNQCKCFEITKNDQLGRHIIATRDIKKGEIILRESPTIIGPKIASFPICLGCHNLLKIDENLVGNSKAQKQQQQKDYYKCSKCTWPLCGPKCETSQYHKAECEIISQRKFICNIKYNGTNNNNNNNNNNQINSAEIKKESAYCVIMPLRFMLLKHRSPETYRKLIELEDHLNERLQTPIYNVLKANLITFIRTILNLTDFDENEILRIAAILDTNTFEIRHQSNDVNIASKLRGLYLTAAMFSHDCIPNTRHLFDDKLQILLIATIDIPKGGMITTTYTQPLKSTLMRQEHLKLSKCFNCSCKRCSDPTELDTFCGAIYCSKCKIGKIISTDPLDNLATWKCQLCPHEIPAKQIIWGNSAIQKEINCLDRSNPKEFEEFIIRYQDTLHEKNTHILQVKYALIQLYGNVPGFLLHELTDAGVKRKIDLCEELLDIAELFEPGWGHFRGILLLDLQQIMVVQTKREFNKGLITKEGAQEKLLESMKLLQEAVKILSLEPGMQGILQERVTTLAKEIEAE